jgi:hypothetical protein
MQSLLCGGGTRLDRRVMMVMDFRTGDGFRTELNKT